MRRIVYKLWWAWDFDREEAWLNTMAAKGLSLVAVGWCRYEFEETTPGLYGVRLQLLEHPPRHPESEQYLRFLEETGVECVGQWMRWVYLRRRLADGPFELFSDTKSKQRQLTLLIRLILVLGIANLVIGGSNLSLFFLNGLAVSLLGFINLGLGIGLLIGAYRLWRRLRLLQADGQLFE